MARFCHKAGLLIWVALVVFLVDSRAFAFSIGDIEIRSKFGENFDASFDINLDRKGPYEVVLGDLNDYKRLGIDRSSLMDSLEIEKTTPLSDLKKTIRVVSRSPLFFPSFNLVIRAKHNGGTLLENFLVTVDFQQGLALSVQDKKNKNSIARQPPADIVKKDLANPNKQEQNLSSELKKQANAELTRKPMGSPAEVRKSPLPNETYENKAVTVEAITPTPLMTKMKNRRKLSGAIWAIPKTVFPIVAQSPDSTPPSIIKDNDGQGKPMDSLQKLKVERGGEAHPEDSIQVEKGESLFSIAPKIKIGNIHPAQIAVALWMSNIDKFMFGNINGIQAGTELDKTQIENLASTIDLKTANKILNSQYQEWVLTKENSHADVDQKPETSIPEVPLPMEKMSEVQSIFNLVGNWKSSWESNDFDSHISLYQEMLKDGEISSSVRERKKHLFLKYPNPSLKLSSQTLIFIEGIPWVVFEQEFLAESLKSKGTKELSLVWVEDNWKINTEEFYIEQNEVPNQTDSSSQLEALAQESDYKHPFIIHVSSHPKKSEAVSITNKLRGNGFDAYWAPVQISRDISIYRVYIGRFVNWSQAHRVVKILRGKRLAGHATAIPYPFALQVGDVASLIEARQLIEKLRSKGLSGLLLISSQEPQKERFRVLVGAFKKQENAIWMMQRLEQAGFRFERVTP